MKTKYLFPTCILTLLLVMGSFSLIHAQTVVAQTAPVCPPPVLLALARSGSACFGLENNQVCYGNGTVSAAPYAGYTTALAQPGDRDHILGLQSLSVAPPPDNSGVSVASLNAQASLTDLEQRFASLLLIGDTTLENLVPPTPEQTLTANATVNIRTEPDPRAEIVERLTIGKTLTANGIDADGVWLRVKIPNTDDLGWVGHDVVVSDGDVRAMAVVDDSTPLFRPYEIMRLTSSADFAGCDGALRAGLLLQTPNVEEVVSVTINDLLFNFAGTFFLRGEGEQITVEVLEGSAETGDVYIPAGARYVGGEVQEYDLSPLAGLPLNNLPRRTAAAEALTPDELAALIETHRAEVELASAPIPEATPDTRCRRQTTRTTRLWGGPGEFYEVINELPEGRYLRPILQSTDPDGEIWWQLSDSNWVRARLIEETGECEPVQIADRVPPPRENTLSLETCKTTNGPLRVGQVVRIEFTPQAFNNWGEARDAPRIDPGRIKVGSRTYRPDATEPVMIGSVNDRFEDRYVRTFYIYWTAVAGTFRIEGTRLHYTPICSVTVPVG